MGVVMEHGRESEIGDRARKREGTLLRNHEVNRREGGRECAADT